MPSGARDSWQEILNGLRWLPSSEQDRRPSIVYSIADAKPGHVEEGPLYQTVINIFSVAKKEGDPGFQRFLAKSSTIELIWKEPLQVPMARRVSMGAYELMKANQKAAQEK
jgi:hypothetical protein